MYLSNPHRARAVQRFQTIKEEPISQDLRFFRTATPMLLLQTYLTRATQGFLGEHWAPHFWKPTNISVNQINRFYTTVAWGSSRPTLCP